MKSVPNYFAIVCLGLVLAVSGCVSQAQYDDCVRRNQIQQEDLDRMDALVNQERLRADQLQQQVDLAQQSEPFLQQQINALNEQLAQKQQIIDQLSEQVGQVALPPELSGALAEWALQSGSDLVTYDDSTGIVRFKSDLLFNLGSDVVQTDVVSHIEQLARIMTSPAAEGFDLLIVGHTDNVWNALPGTMAKHPSNRHLSAHRAISVENILARIGVNGKRIAVMGLGEFHPIAANAPDNSGNPLNRRVEIYIVPAGQIRVSIESP
ncbi:MAG: OmpA family protein [Planctomycetes bacterium]|nr:OmpA family protein [Planctomycetota bacterium]